MSHLGSNQRFRFNDRFCGNWALGFSNLLQIGLLGRGNGKLGLLDRGSRGRLFGRRNRRGWGGAATTQHLLNLSSVITSVLLAHGGDVIGLLLGDASKLGSLSIDCIRSVLEVVINQLLVGGVNQGHEEGYRGGNNGKAPVRHELYEMIRKEGSHTGLFISHQLAATK